MPTTAAATFGIFFKYMARIMLMRQLTEAQLADYFHSFTPRVLYTGEEDGNYRQHGSLQDGNYRQHG